MVGVFSHVRHTYLRTRDVQRSGQFLFHPTFYCIIVEGCSDRRIGLSSAMVSFSFTPHDLVSHHVDISVMPEVLEGCVQLEITIMYVHSECAPPTNDACSHLHITLFT